MGGYNHNALGCEFARAASWQFAISEFEKAVQLNPWAALFKANLARAWLSAGNLTKAQAMADAALKQAPSLVDAMFAKALAEERSGRPHAAILWYRKSLSSKPSLGIKRDAEESLEILLADFGEPPKPTL